MKLFLKIKFLLSACFFLFLTKQVSSQCTTLGQTPATAFPVCGTTVFKQKDVPLCSTNDLFVPGCSGTASGANYQNKNPFFYKFTCYTAGTLGFDISPLAADEDYDWQLYDITGHNPNDIFTVNSLVVTGNWAGTYGHTGASSGGLSFIQCASNPTAGANAFAAMPNLIAGHEYLLMISHFTDGQSGYDLSFGGGTADITDPLKPHMIKATASCDGKSITVQLNKKVRCNSLSTNGSEFSLLNLSSVAVSAVSDSCSFGFDFDEVTIKLATALTSGTHTLVIHNGTDVNTLLDACGNAVPSETITFDYFIPQPILADSLGKIKCSIDSVLIYYPKKIKCSSISPSGSDFTITGPTPVTVVAASGNCVNDLSDYIVVKFASPIYTKGTYNVSIQPGLDGSPIFDVCGQPLLAQFLPFTTSDTVSALFSYSSKFGCQRDTLTFAHDGAHDVNNWNWSFNSGSSITTQTHSIIWPATSSNTVQLIVSNGVCKDTVTSAVKLDNEVKAIFTMTDFICPEDKLEVINNSTGQIDIWRWNYDVVGSSNLKNPSAFLFPTLSREAYYTVKLVATNSALNCSDSAKKTLTVLDFCLIAVPTAFTPNNDGLNDTFSPHNALKAGNLIFKVYNRWGQLLFQSRTWRDRWDGKVNGVLQASGVYVWMLSYTNTDTRKQVFQKGTVTLIR